MLQLLDVKNNQTTSSNSNRQVLHTLKEIKSEFDQVSFLPTFLYRSILREKIKKNPDVASYLTPEGFREYRSISYKNLSLR